MFPYVIETLAWKFGRTQNSVETLALHTLYFLKIFRLKFSLSSIKGELELDSMQIGIIIYKQMSKRYLYL